MSMSLRFMSTCLMTFTFMSSSFNQQLICISTFEKKYCFLSKYNPFFPVWFNCRVILHIILNIKEWRENRTVWSTVLWSKVWSKHCKVFFTLTLFCFFEILYNVANIQIKKQKSSTFEHLGNKCKSKILVEDFDWHSTVCCVVHSETVLRRECGGGVRVSEPWAPPPAAGVPEEPLLAHATPVLQ